MLNPHFRKESSSFDVGQAVMSSRRKCEKRHIGFLTSIYREGTSQTVYSFALQILRQGLLHCIPRKTRHVRWLLRCTPFFRDGSFPAGAVKASCSDISGPPRKLTQIRRRAGPAPGRQWYLTLHNTGEMPFCASRWPT